MNSSRERIGSPSRGEQLVERVQVLVEHLARAAPSALAGSKLKMWHTQSKTNASTLALALLRGRVSVVAMSGSFLLGDARSR